MSVPMRSRCIRMAQQCADDRQGGSRGYSDACKGMTEIMQAQIRHAGSDAKLCPNFRHAFKVSAISVARKNKIRTAHATDPNKNITSGSIEDNTFLTIL